MLHWPVAASTADGCRKKVDISRLMLRIWGSLAPMKRKLVCSPSFSTASERHAESCNSEMFEMFCVVRLSTDESIRPPLPFQEPVKVRRKQALELSFFGLSLFVEIFVSSFLVYFSSFLCGQFKVACCVYCILSDRASERC